VSRETRKNRNIKVANKFFENMERFKYLGMTLNNQNGMHEETKGRLNSENACGNSVQNICSSLL
jgi:hypothetical protein